MKYLLSANGAKQYSADFMREYENLDKHGLIKGCEFYIPEPIDGMGKVAKDFRNQIFQIHAPDLDNISTFDIIDLMGYYHDLAVESDQHIKVIIHPLISINPETGMMLTYQRLKFIQRQIDKNGLWLELLVENLNPLNGIKRCDTGHIKQILDELNVGFCWDTGHDVLCGNNEYALPLKNALRLQTVHLHDIGNRFDHQPFYFNNVSHKRTMEYLKAIRYDGNLVLEIAMDYLKGDTLHEKQIEYVRQFELMGDNV